MKKFSNLIFEAAGNVYQIGTPFSNGHRSRKNGDGFLFDQHLMIDIDQIIFNPDGSIWAIVENKKQLPGPSSKLKNILTTTTFQKMALLELSKRLNCHFFVYVELDKSYHLIKDLSGKKTFTEENFNKTKSERNYSILDTDNKIFVEFRNKSNNITFISIDTRIGDSDSLVKNTSKNISQTLNVPNIEIDDSGEYIEFYINGVLNGRVESVLNPKTIESNLKSRLEIEWELIYKKMGIF
jgi:hypothetical protein